MRKLFSLFTIFSFVAAFTACENKETPAQTSAITISADKQSIVADGEDKVTFTALVNGQTSTEAMIISLKDNRVLTNNSFTTTEAGEYSFVAVVGKESSEPVTVTATAPEVPAPAIELSADVTTITANNSDTVTFTVTVDGADKSSECTITNLNYNIELEGNTFKSDATGEFKFVAKYQQWTSNEVTITVTQLPAQRSLRITASKMRFKADGTDSVTFTVVYGEEDVTASCTIHTTTGTVIEGNEFTTTTAGSYNIYALYDNTRSNTISIDAYDPTVASQYEIGQIYEINGTKGMIYAIKSEADGSNWVYMCSLDEVDIQWSTENVVCNCISTKGEWNTYDPFDPQYSRADGGVRDINNYPAFKWCMEHGDGWFLPSSRELQWMWDAISDGTHKFDNASVEKFNKILTDNGGMPFVETYYWSSNETAHDSIELIAFMEDSVACLEPYKNKTYTARAAYRFQF